MTTVISVAAGALIGPARTGATVRRSRPMTHVLGPGLHRTHFPCVVIYTTIRLFYHLVLSGIIPMPLWDMLWRHRDRIHFGPFLAMGRACDLLGITWSTSTCLRAASTTCSFRIPAELIGQASRGAASSLSKAARLQTRLHNLRAFLRRCVAAGEAGRRPKDFAGLERGLSELRDAREHM